MPSEAEKRPGECRRDRRVSSSELDRSPNPSPAPPRGKAKRDANPFKINTARAEAARGSPPLPQGIMLTPLQNPKANPNFTFDHKCSYNNIFPPTLIHFNSASYLPKRRWQEKCQIPCVDFLALQPSDGQRKKLAPRSTLAKGSAKERRAGNEARRARVSSGCGGASPAKRTSAAQRAFGLLFFPPLLFVRQEVPTAETLGSLLLIVQTQFLSQGLV